MHRMFRVSLEATAIVAAALSLAAPANAGNGSAVGAGLLGLALERWLAVQSHHKRCMSLRHRPSTTPHLLLFMSRQHLCTWGRHTTMGDLTIKAIDAEASGAHLRPRRGLCQC